jgi:RHS repeat-associated protein
VLAARSTTTTSTWWPPLSIAEPDVGAPIDANGNLTSDGTRSFEWDARDRLVAVVVGSERIEYDVDGVGRRAKWRRLFSGTTTEEHELVWCGIDVCEVRHQGGPIERRSPQGVLIGAEPVYAVADVSGSVSSRTDMAGGLIARYEYDPWGRPSVVTGATSTAEYSVYLSEPVGNLWLAPWRAYSAEYGRWLSEDPVRDGVHRYAFVSNRPTALSDVDGLQGIPRPPGWFTKPLQTVKLLRCAYQQELCIREVQSACRGRFGDPGGWLGGVTACDLCELRNRQCCSDQAVRCMTEIPFFDPRDEKWA